MTDFEGFKFYCRYVDCKFVLCTKGRDRPNPLNLFNVAHLVFLNHGVGLLIWLSRIGGIFTILLPHHRLSIHVFPLKTVDQNIPMSSAHQHHQHDRFNDEKAARCF